MAKHPFPDGTVDWSGDNPGIYLKQSADGPFISLMVWFRVALSSHGKGHALVLFEDSTRSMSWPGIANFCISDNQPLARHLVENFCNDDAAAWPAADGAAHPGRGSGVVPRPVRRPGLGA